LQILTNGIYPSIEHRAMVDLNKERLSIATFYSPGWEVLLRPASTLVNPETPALFKTISVSEFYMGYLGGELHGKSYLDSLRIQNEH
jgi:isopenicillin N synthase-like dioxygenase